MKQIIVHLSDMHIRSSSDSILRRTDHIVSAIQSIEHDPVSLCVLALSGDIAFSGSSDQYEMAINFLGELVKGLLNKLPHAEGQPTKIEMVAVPGNHDCHLPTDNSAARRKLVKGPLRRPLLAKDVDVVGACLQAQGEFFEFADAVSTKARQATAGFDARLYYEHRFDTGDQTIRFICCNTAWLSQRQEQQATLFFPPDAISDQKDSDELTIALFHHPYVWLEAESGRAFRKRVEKIADIVLTGHEHDADRSMKEGHRGERNLYLEGGALQITDQPATSAFNVLVLDAKAKMQRVIMFDWDGVRYVNRSATTEWEELQVNRLRQRGYFSLRQSMENDLEDLGINVTHPVKGSLKLTDLYVYPDTLEVPYPFESPGASVKGEDLVEYVHKHELLIITGDDQAGKTCMTKRLFLDLLDRRFVPILITSLNQLPDNETKIYSWLSRVFSEEYEQPEADFEQLDKPRRVVIVDNYHSLNLKPNARRKFVSALAKYAGKVILLASDILAEVEELVSPARAIEGRVFTHLQIQPLGHLRRNTLIARWLQLDPDDDEESPDFARKLNDIERKLDTIIGKNYVPSYPVFVVSVLQAYSAMTPVDTRMSTHGYFYELFIRTALARGRSSVELDIMAAYLAHAAYGFFSEARKTVSKETFVRIHKEYETKSDIALEVDSMIQELTRLRFMEPTGDGLRFKYPFVYYYFVARYMTDHLGEPRIKAEVVRLAAQLHVEENANIFIFLAHFTKDALLIDEMLKAAGSYFRDTVPAKLEDDVKFLNTLESSATQMIYEERDRGEAKRAVLEAKDREEETERRLTTAEGTAQAGKDQVAAEPVAQLSGALKTLQILGQILKNFPGSLEGNVKLAILQSCYSLGLRSLGTVMSYVGANQEQVLREIVRAIKIQHPTYSEADLKKHALNSVLGLARLIAFGMIRRISGSVGAAELTRTYQRAYDESDKTASIRLIHTSISLDHIGPFPERWIKELAECLEKTPLAKAVLQLLTIEYFHLFPVDYRTKQRTCASLGIQHVPLGIQDRRKLVGEN